MAGYCVSECRQAVSVDGLEYVLVDRAVFVDRARGGDLIRDRNVVASDEVDLAAFGGEVDAAQGEIAAFTGGMDC